MGTKSPGPPQRCQLILQQCLAIQLTKPGHTPEDFWMYDSGYMIFQNFLAANSKCWWNAPLTAATRSLKYAGHVAPGMLLVTAEPCALEILRGAYARSVLKAPATYVISSVGDIDDCIIQPTPQTQFTPLPEALCDVIMDLTSQGQSATIETIKHQLGVKFPQMQQPSTEIIYDALAQLMQERKIYQTSKGYFIVTPERRRSRSRPRGGNQSASFEHDDEPYDSRTILMTNSEALHSLYGEITTERDGDLTHQCIQTNLADVICGGNPNDKVLYPRASKRRSASFPTPRSLERRHSLRLFGSSKRLQRCASTRTFSFRSLSKNYAQTLNTDSSSSEYQSTDSSPPKKSASLLSRLFRRSGRSKQKNIQSYSGQFPPAEWFNSKAVHLHSVGTQTVEHDVPGHILSNSTFFASEASSQRSLTLPRRHRRHLSSDSTFLISSRDCSPIRRRSPQCYNGSLPRSTHSIPNSTRSPKRQPLIKASDEANRAKSAAEVYKNRNAVDSKIASEREKHKSIYSGPSSLESGKASIGGGIGGITSGPSSIESGKFPYSRTSGHSSLDSHSSNTLNTSQSPVRKPPVTRKISSDIEIGLPSSQSNNSITLQVTNSTAMPSTKIFVQNSPARSVITFENGKLNDNSNVYIINSEKTTHANGETTTHKSVSRQTTKLAPKATCSDCEETEETGDSLSMISENSPDSSLNAHVNLEMNKFNKNINNEHATMNNNRKLNIQLPQNGGNFVYKNVLKDIPSSPSSPNNKNFFGDNKTYEQMAGSVGNLRQIDSQPKKLNSNLDLKTATTMAENNMKLQNTNMSMVNLLRKNSEPNLSVKTIEKQKITIDVGKKENNDRRLSIGKETATTQKEEQENCGYNFPSLTDLSFNFTSIAAQKILQGVSINSIDTLCEINMPDKAQSNAPSNKCTDYGMV